VVVISGEGPEPKTVAYGLGDGKLLWAEDSTMYQPVSANGRILVEGNNDHTRPPVSKILDIVTGRIVFTYPNTQYVPMAASPDGKKFYVGWGHSLQMMDATTGKVSWIASYVYPQFAVVTPTRLYLTTWLTNKVIAFDRSTNKIAWTKTEPTFIVLRPIVAGGVLYVTAPTKELYALNPVNGATLKTLTVTPLLYPPVVTGGRMYLTDSAQMSVYGL
jgi:outer membrane protein assembly factor BamB